MVRRSWAKMLAAAALLLPVAAHASLFQGEALDAVANGVAWVALIIAPIVGIGLFWYVHIIPEKMAEKRRHPQAQAIQMLCILSLFFGGLLWPLALLWAYTKPVLHKMAYGTDVLDEQTLHKVQTGDGEAAVENAIPTAHVSDELRRLREQLDRLSQRAPTAQELDAMRHALATLEANGKQGA